MKILHLNATLTGGAARAALRLHGALLQEGVDSLVYVQDTRGGVPHDRILSPQGLSKAWARLRPYLDKAPILLYPKRTKGTFNIGWLPFSGVLRAIEKIKPSIVHLHWIGRGVIPIYDLPKIPAPLVWSLHDLWAFSGGDHLCYDENEHTYKHSYILNSPFDYDLATFGFNMKKRAYAQIPHLCVVGASHWISHKAQQSVLLQDKTHCVIPNPLDTARYQPLDQKTCQKLLGLDTDQPLIAFGALDMRDPNKGADLLLEALHHLKGQQIELVIFGADTPKGVPHLPFRTHYLGRLTDSASLVALYNAVDVLVVPSRQENLSNVILESLACGTPVVAFGVGGNGDLVSHQENGYLARSFDVLDLAAGIKWVLNTPDYPKLCTHARMHAETHFSQEVVTKKYITLYEGILHG
ncbi:glycosyltransferase [Helicobacter bizzozeronii]|uniref:glycosyltransferase n=1 Tax=Helicobacter bizzozeronii TaxID=56877 RepID=UPI000CEE2E8B|nr:glycosyltransferase [Helicobacter bizzozeronii]